MDKGYYKNSKYVHLWVHLLLRANHQPTEFMWNKKMIIVKKGQFITGRKQLSLETRINESTVENILQMLENEQQIEQQKTTKFRLITIKNWELYQSDKSDKQQKEQQSNNRVTTKEQQNNTNKNDKNKENDHNEKKKDKEGTEDFFSEYSDLNNENFIKVWDEWLGFRKEIKKPLTISAQKKQLKFLSENKSDAIEIIEQSIRNQWQGLFELKNQSNETFKNRSNTGSNFGTRTDRPGQDRNADYTGAVKTV